MVSEREQGFLPITAFDGLHQQPVPRCFLMHILVLAFGRDKVARHAQQHLQMDCLVGLLEARMSGPCHDRSVEGDLSA